MLQCKDDKLQQDFALQQEGALQHHLLQES